MADDLPAVSGEKLLKLLKKDGWTEYRQTRHGVSLFKIIGGEKRVTIIPKKSKALPQGTLKAILSQKQTGIGRQGLLRLLSKKRNKSEE